MTDRKSSTSYVYRKKEEMKGRGGSIVFRDYFSTHSLFVFGCPDSSLQKDPIHDKRDEEGRRDRRE